MSIATKLKEILTPMTLAALVKISRGSVARRFDQIVADVMRNITQFPALRKFTDKGVEWIPQPREIYIKVTFLPVVQAQRVMIESENGGPAQETSVPKVIGITTDITCYPKLPEWRNAPVSMLVDTNKTGAITEIMFNPDCDTNPEQMALAFEDDDEK